MGAALFMSNVPIALKIFNGVKFVIISVYAQDDLTNVSTVKHTILSMRMLYIITGQIVSVTQFCAQMGVQNIFIAII